MSSSDELLLTLLPSGAGEFKPIESVRFSVLPVTTTTPTTAPTTSSSSSPNSVVASTSSTPSVSTSSTSTSTSQVAANDPNTTSRPNPSLVIGLVIGILVLLALGLFLVRYMFIRHRRQHRESGQRLAYSKARFAISGPTNFTILESGTFANNEVERPSTSMSIQPSLQHWSHGGDGDRAGSPERMRERYPFEAMNGLESGLKDQMQSMKSVQLGSRKPVPVYITEVDLS